MKKWDRILTILILMLSLCFVFCSCGKKYEVVSDQSKDVVLKQFTYEPENVSVSSLKSTNDNKLAVVLEEDEVFEYEDLLLYIKEYPNLKIFKAKACLLTANEYIEIKEMYPDLTLETKVRFENRTLDLSKREIDISKKIVWNKNDFDKLLSCIPAGKKLVMCDCGYSNEQMAGLREKYPNLEFAWRIYMGKWNLRTDDEAFSVMIYDYTHTRLLSKDIEVLKYCTNMKALDLGHQWISDLSVIGQMTDLRVLILADNAITDVKPLANLKNLEYLELFVNQIRDISPLAECTNLVDLNFGWNYVRDLTPIYNLEKLERLWLPNTRTSLQHREEIVTNFPDTKIIFSDPNSISSGWRTHERYFSMRGMFLKNKYDENFIK